MSLSSALRTSLQDAIESLGGNLIFAKAIAPNNLASGNRDPDARDSDIAFGQPNPQDVIESTRLKWVHLNTAGYTRYDNDAVRDALRSRGAIMTNSSAVYSEPCAEHVLAFMMSHARSVQEAFASQQKSKWDFDILRPKMRVLEGESALIIGFGAIGQRVAEILQVMRMNVSAIRRKPRGDELIPVAATDQLDALLPHADHVVNTLPSSSGTIKMFDASRFARMRRGAVIYNVGRGDTVDQIALQSALNSGHVAAAYLDVTTPEPLPSDDPLWTTPNCYITPHIAGGVQDETCRLVDHFIANLKRWATNSELINPIV